MKKLKIKIVKYILLNIIFTAVFILSGSYVSADDVVLDWAKQIGGTGADVANSIVIDSTGNVYTVGTFTGTVDFDPGAGTSNLVSGGNTDIFVSKLDSSGNFIWAKQIVGAGIDLGRYIAIDSIGNIYITGQFEDTADFDPGVGISNLTSFGSADVFVSKLDSDGDFIWAKQLGGEGVDIGKSVTVDSGGNVYTVGDFTNTADFDPGVGTFNIASPANNGEVFVSKLDSDGDFVWAKNMGGTAQDFGISIAVDSDGNVYTSGYFNTTGDFDPGAGTSNLVSAGGTDIFISKLNSSGDYVWAKKMGSTSADVGNSMTLDSDENVYTTGSFTGTVDFDPGAGTSNLVSAGGTDIFISKLNSSGDFVSAQKMGGTAADVAYSISLDLDGNIYTTGNLTGTADFDPGAGTSNLVSAGSTDIFVSKLDSSGNYVWAKKMGGTGADIGRSVSLDSDSNTYVAGQFTGTADFDPRSGTYNLVSSGSNDIFISKFVLDVFSPIVQTLSPVDGATDVALASNLVITFDEAVDVETGNITIYKSSDDSVVEAIDVTGGLVTGTGTTTITINPTSNLLGGPTDYYVQIDATAFDDTSGNSFAGILDETTWNFTTIDVTAPTISETTPVITPASDTTPDYTFTTDEAGDITYGGSCTSLTTTASIGANTISFETLVLGTYTDCTITVTDDALNDSNILAVTAFTIEEESSGSSSSGSRRTSNKVVTSSDVSSTNTDGCTATTAYSPKTGAKCPEVPTPTPSAPICLLTQTLKQGSTGEEVKCLQNKLQITSDGMFGPKTKGSVMTFQKLKNLISDGIVGPKTRESLHINN